MFELKVPTIGESITSAIVGTWQKAVGEVVAEGETVVALDSDKASLDVPSPVSGVLRERLAVEGDEVAIGAVLARIEVGATAEATAEAAPASPAVAPPAAAPSPAAPSQAAPSPAAPAAAPAGPGRPATPSANGPQTGPAARRVAAEKGVDIHELSGSGARGRVLSRDVAAAPAEPPLSPWLSAAPASASAPASAERAERAEERVPLTPLRRTIARRLVHAQQTAAMLTTFNEVDLHNVMALRKRYQDAYVKRYGLKLGFMSFFIKAAIEALKAFPAVNAELDDSDSDRPVLVYKRYYNVGVAVSTDRGLMVPVVKDADRLSFAETELAIGELAARGRDGKLKLEDFQDGTFTISNGGVFGSLLSTPILNPPQVAILGMHTIQERPVGVDGQVVLRPMMYLALSYDHRVIDGREAVSFLVRIKELVEAPERILIEV